MVIFGIDFIVKDIVEFWDICCWLNQMYGVDLMKEGVQVYYNLFFELYVSWEVDYIKVDDMMY